MTVRNALAGLAVLIALGAAPLGAHESAGQPAYEDMHRAMDRMERQLDRMQDRMEEMREHMTEMHRGGHGMGMMGQDSMGQGMMGQGVTGDADRDFVASMIPHHQDAIDMAKIVLERGKDEEVRKLAEAVIAAQGTEIAQMKAWLEKHPAQ